MSRRKLYSTILLLAFIVNAIGIISCFDSASSCPQTSRNSRASSRSLSPCDLTKQNYCNTPGSNYPWHAIRRFVHENQGLMKRMYGNQRHARIVKLEIDENDRNEEVAIDEYLEIMLKKNKAKSLSNEVEEKLTLRPKSSPTTNTDTTTVNKDQTTKISVNDTLDSNKNITTEKDYEKKISNVTKLESNTTMKIEDEKVSYKTSILYKDGATLESIANVEINHLDPNELTYEAFIRQSVESNSLISEFPEIKEDPPLSEIKNFTDLMNESTFKSPDDSDMSTSNTESSQTDETTKPLETESASWKPVLIDTSTLPSTLLFSEHDKKVKDDKKEPIKEEFHPRPHKENIRPTVLKLGGVNACSIKSEILAPFWANNTRGEQLVLVNMYPFEQFVHQEKCTNENAQMYCRDGCRCEQQYRLHRLLAYDPYNDCRGIFADWFSFPSCCVCKCYEVPLEYRIASRSPRVMPSDYDTAELLDNDVYERINEDIYKHVASEWYNRRKRDDEF